MRRLAVYESDVERDCSVSGLDGLDQRTETALESPIGQLPWRAEGCGEFRQRATATWPTLIGAGRSSADSPGQIPFAASWCGTSPAPHLPLRRSPHLPLQSAPAGIYAVKCSSWIVWPVETKSSARRKKTEAACQESIPPHMALYASAAGSARRELQIICGATAAG